MFNTQSNEFYTVLKKFYGHDYWEHSMHIFETHDEALACGMMQGVVGRIRSFHAMIAEDIDYEQS